MRSITWGCVLDNRNGVRVGWKAAVVGAAMLALVGCGSSKKVATPTKTNTPTTTGTTVAITVAPVTTAPPIAATTVKPATTAPAVVAVPAGYVKESDTGALVYGVAGPRVAALQKRLKALGFDPGPADGAFGDQTDKVVKAFQTSKSLTADGAVGPQTSAAIDAACAKASC